MKSTEIQKWRMVLDGGEDFIERYLLPFSTRENAVDFLFRRSVSVNPAFAAGAVTDIKNAIFQRASEIRRIGGCASYLEAISGFAGGVNGRNYTMNAFIGNEVLIELIGMGVVGVLVDMPDMEYSTMQDGAMAKPSLTVYEIERINKWEYGNDGELLYVEYVRDKEERDEYGVLLNDQKQETVLITRDIIVIGDGDDKTQKENKLGHVPFVIFSLNHGLLRDIAQHQIALLNISSSDINYAITANFPLYTEQQNQNVNLEKYLKKEDDSVDEEEIGVKHGRAYPVGAERPGFIHPSPEPLLASMEKQRQLKEELRQIVSLSVSTMRARMESAESKQQDNEGLESGLASIGTELEAGERQIAKIWSLLEGDNAIAEIYYPERYEVKDTDKVLARVDKALTIMEKVPTLEAQKEIMKGSITMLLSNNVNDEKLDEMLDEIDKLDIVVTSPKILDADVEAGLIDSETVAELKHYPDDSVAKAQAERLARAIAVAEAQNSEVRGVPETNPMGKTQDAIDNANGARGEGKFNNNAIGD